MASGSVCSAIGCNLYAGNSRGVSFFRFPRDPKRCQKWITNCCRKDLEDFLKRSKDYLYFNHKLCANHFDDSQFANKMRNRLVPNAVPSLLNVPDEMLDSSLKATTQKRASGDKVTHASDHATVEQTILVGRDGSSRAGKRKYLEDPACGIYLEMFGDAKLMSTPAVVLERVRLPELRPKETKENPRSQPEVVSLTNPVTKTPVEREDAVKQLKRDLQKLKQELDKERTWHKNHESYVEMVEQKQQRKDETVESERSSQLQKQTNCEALFASPFWIKVEEASNSPDKKVYYVFSGINGTSDPDAIKATNLPCSANQHQSKAGKNVPSTSKNSPHETKHRKSNEEQGDGRIKSESTVLQQTTPDDTSNIGPYGTTPWKSNEEQGDGRIQNESTVPDTSANSSSGSKKGKSKEGKVEKRMAQDSMVLVLTTADGKVKYKCTKCRKCFRGKKRLLQHIAALHSHMSFECNLCQTSYKDKRQFSTHLNVCHNSQIPNNKKHCNICGRDFSARYRFEEHLAFHAQKLFGCNACKASFVEVDDLKRHLPCPLATAGMPAFLCLRCDETFYSRTQLQRHARCNHSLTPKTANEYKKSYSYNQEQETRFTVKLKRKRQETGFTVKLKRKRYACETCDKKFKLVEALGKHLPCAVRICEVCDKQFKDEARLNLHVKLCHNSQAVKCSLCGSRFVSKGKLNVHEILFRGLCQGRFFVCNYCGQKTKYAAGFSKHLQTHERKVPGISNKFSTSVKAMVKLESDLQFQSSNISEKPPINVQTMLQLESDCEILSSSISNKCRINAQIKAECESDPEFLCVD